MIGVPIVLALALLGCPTAPSNAQQGGIIPPNIETAVSVAPSASGGIWRDAGRVTWYGYGLYNHRTACGQRLTRHLVGVAHRTLPCGTKVAFRWHGRIRIVTVVDRGPYPCGVHGRCRANKVYRFDWTAGTAALFGGYYTRTGVRYRVVRR